MTEITVTGWEARQGLKKDGTPWYAIDFAVEGQGHVKWFHNQVDVQAGLIFLNQHKPPIRLEAEMSSGKAGLRIDEWEVIDSDVVAGKGAVQVSPPPVQSPGAPPKATTPSTTPTPREIQQADLEAEYDAYLASQLRRARAIVIKAAELNATMLGGLVEPTMAKYAAVVFERLATPRKFWMDEHRREERK